MDSEEPNGQLSPHIYTTPNGLLADVAYANFLMLKVLSKAAVQEMKATLDVTFDFQMLLQGKDNL